jgi:hypothetical protein
MADVALLHFTAIAKSDNPLGIEGGTVSETSARACFGYVVEKLTIAEIRDGRSQSHTTPPTPTLQSTTNNAVDPPVTTRTGSSNSLSVSGSSQPPLPSYPKARWSRREPEKRERQEPQKRRRPKTEGEQTASAMMAGGQLPPPAEAAPPEAYRSSIAVAAMMGLVGTSIPPPPPPPEQGIDKHDKRYLDLVDDGPGAQEEEDRMRTLGIGRWATDQSVARNRIAAASADAFSGTSGPDQVVVQNAGMQAAVVDPLTAITPGIDRFGRIHT